ncbi:MAG: NERD domain-containing protein [Mesorhizobium sp.]|uniref:nuclease-related domain-containing protein n=1 Tax=Mesorhizobium sp. TaxID=1871066 RepID=UPI000FE525EA|nr:nuclease-related domain-containing protein [Mesorhizobium sp.]RWB24901.1 MAG: NERD domain-containing protein [Mesorhizobium sp.]TIU91088.1 MAG: NERD domain-containing protein [Mesorhizobium sp.]
MARQFFRGRPFRNTHENRAFDRLCHAVKLYTQSTDDVRVIGNVEYDSGQIDALVLKSHAITIVDFKDWGGVITIGPNLPWVNQDGLKVKGGSYANPFMQICAYRAELASDLETAKWPGQDYSHISGFVLFLQNTEFQSTPMIPSAERPVIGSALVTGTVAYSTSATCHPQSWTSRSPSSTNWSPFWGSIPMYLSQKAGLCQQVTCSGWPRNLLSVGARRRRWAKLALVGPEAGGGLLPAALGD